ncbi:MAG: hypothetical protein A2Y36_04725 [Treponema sp. GWA1_62_8]|nr:MAG: hypothetical protein A2Y36_04725 [Treponema sp. GWA1_62_8]
MIVKKTGLIFFAAVTLAFFAIAIAFYSLNPFLDGGRKSFEQIQPGETSLTELKKDLGEPVQTEKTQGTELLYYPTQSKYYQNSVALEGEKILYTRRFFPTPLSFKEYKSSYGDPDLVLYDNETEGSQWLVYLRRGIAFNVEGNEIFQVIRFSPTDKKTFIKISIVVGLSENKPEGTIEEPE